VLVYDTASVSSLATIFLNGISGAIIGAGDLNRLALSLDGGSLFASPQNLPFAVRIETASNEVMERITFGTDNPDYGVTFVIP
jgi:hypothetical protein